MSEKEQEFTLEDIIKEFGSSSEEEVDLQQEEPADEPVQVPAEDPQEAPREEPVEESEEQPVEATSVTDDTVRFDPAQVTAETVAFRSTVKNTSLTAVLTVATADMAVTSFS